MKKEGSLLAFDFPETLTEERLWKALCLQALSLTLGRAEEG